MLKTPSKKRYANPKRSFSIKRYKNDTKLSVEYWNLKAGNSNSKIIWAVKTRLVHTTLNPRDVPFV